MFQITSIDRTIPPTMAINTMIIQITREAKRYFPFSKIYCMPCNEHARVYSIVVCFTQFCKRFCNGICYLRSTYYYTTNILLTLTWKVSLSFLWRRSFNWLANTDIAPTLVRKFCREIVHWFIVCTFISCRLNY